MLTGGHLFRLFRVSLAVAVLVWMMPASASAQAGAKPGAKPAAPTAKAAAPSTAKPTASGVPRTPWGDPDFMGVWEHEERPAQNRPNDEALANGIFNARKSRYDPTDKRGAMTSQWSKEKPLIVDPADGIIPALPGKIFFYDPVIRGDHWKNHFVGERCITKGVPDMYLRGDVHRIIQSPGWVVMISEFIHDVREIPVDGRPHVGAAIRQWNGDPRGRWDGETLVVETTNFNDLGQVYAELGAGIKQSDAMRLSERWTRTDKETIVHRLTIDDPKVFSRPWTIEKQHKLQPPGFFVVEYACHEGNTNYMSGTLKQGRIRDERAAGAGKKP